MSPAIVAVFVAMGMIVVVIVREVVIGALRRFMKMFVRIMKMNMSLPCDLAEQIIDTEENEGTARNPRKPGADLLTQDCAE